jgi:CheY-like chemotaxis protein
MKKLPSQGSFSRFGSAARYDLKTMLDPEISTIFVVDDEELITTSLRLILGRQGFEVFAFTRPLEALDRMHSVVPDLLISDVMMPQLSGIQLAIETRKLLPGCRILLFSAAALDLGLQTRAQGHDFRMLQKPVHPDALLQEIAALAVGP